MHFSLHISGFLVLFIVFLPIKLRLFGKYSRMPVNIHHVIQSEAKNDNLVSMVKKPSKKWAEPRQKEANTAYFIAKIC